MAKVQDYDLKVSELKLHVNFYAIFLLLEPYPSHHNGLFSPLLVLRDFAAREADQYWCYPNSM